MDKYFISWGDLDFLVKKLAKQIAPHKSKYTSLFGIPRGGIYVAQALSVYLNLPLTTELKKDSLVVDDIVDSGKTLKKYKGYDTAVLHDKPNASVKPYYSVEQTTKWVVYPWEINSGKDEGLQHNIVRLLQFIGEDPNREGLKETPKRVENAWKFWTKGYKEDSKKVMKTFTNPGIDQLIVVPRIDFYSMCEHHLAPFYGQIHIGYVPNGKVLGVSKFARLTEIYARRLQIQERLGQEVANDIMKYLKPQGVGVVIRGVHLCMRSRGVEKQNSEMITSVMLGFFRDKPELREEFLNLIGKGG